MNKNTRRYHIRNWPQYITALINRGSLTLWIDHHSINHWLNARPAAGRGRPLLYADAAITCALLIREVYHLPLRQTQGFILSLFDLLHIDLPVPHYSTLCRRARSLRIKLLPLSPQQPLHLLIDSSGLKVYGEGEWYVRLRKQYKRRTWRKTHIAMDWESELIHSAIGSHKDLLDRFAVVDLLDQVHSPLAVVYADGAYDYKVCYKAIYEKGGEAIIPPKQKGVLHKQEWMASRNRNIKQMRRVGLDKWKRKSGYHRRSLIETAFFRLKKIFSDRLRSKRTESQDAEMMIRCAALNRMTSLGMPDSYAV
ncbi:MAG TPA: IS5 family transposase [Candidatus Saccharimonadales bacterium]|nr:IS5 family transposase [Candidatus Saccharimonadales bacterium]